MAVKAAAVVRRTPKTNGMELRVSLTQQNPVLLQETHAVAEILPKNLPLEKGENRGKQ